MKVLRLDAVVLTMGLARSTIYKLICSGEFPQAVSLTRQRVGWIDSEVHDWILVRIEERDLGEGGVVRPPAT